MSYEVTATRRRPRTFDQLVGQDFVVATLKNSIAAGRIAHAYLFAGPRGVGKTSAARILAKALNCPDGPDAEGCADYEGSEEIARGTALDVIEIDGASNTSVNDVRQIKDEVLFAPNSSRYKIYIIDEVHMLSNSAFNALLKTIEEPPPYIVFIFATTEIHKVPATIRSRCQQFNFRLIPTDEIKRLLAEAVNEIGVEADDDALAWVGKEATGSLRDAYTLFDQVLSFSDRHITLAGIQTKLGLLGFDRLNVLAEACASSNTAQALGVIEDALQSGVSVERLTIDIADYFRTLLLIDAGVHRETVLGVAVERIPENIRQAFDRGRLELANEILLQLYRDIRYSVNQRYELELAVSRLAALSDYLTPQALVERIEALQHEILHEEAYRRGQDDMEPSSKTQAAPSPKTAPPRPSPTAPPPGPATVPQPATTPGPESSPDTRAASPSRTAPPPSPATPAPPEGVATDSPSDSPAASVADDAASEEGGPPAVRYVGISAEKIEAIVARFRSHRISVAALLERTREWRLADATLVIIVDDDYGVSALDPERDEVRAVAADVLETEQLKITITTAETEVEPQQRPDSQAEMVRKMFGGEYLESES